MAPLAGRTPSSSSLNESELARRIDAFDWSKTPLGPVDHWPQSLVTAVRILLGSRFPMFVWWGRDLTNLYNDAYAPMLGARHPGALGRRAAEIWSDVWPVVGPQTEVVIKEGKSTWNEELLLVMERNGFLEEAYFTFSYSPAPDDEGGVGGVFCAVTEDTSRVLSQRRLRTLRVLAERASDGKTPEAACEIAAATLEDSPHDVPFALFYLIDAGGERAELAAATRLPPGSTASPAIVELDHPTATWPFREVIEKGRTVLVEDLADRYGPLPGGAWPESPRRAVVLPIAKSAQSRYSGLLVLGLSPRLVFDDDYLGFASLLAGHVATAVANAQAYDEERRRAEALAELDRAKTRFFTNISHEFRTPLTLLLGPIGDLLARGDDGMSAEDRASLEVAHRNALRLLKLVNTLLDFSRIEAGRMEAVYRETDVASLTRELASVFRSATENAGLRLRVDCPPIAAPVYLDRDLWEKIVLNLLSNALKSTFEGEIEVVLRDRGDAIELVVRDTGTGIPAAELPHVFERFRRVEGAKRRSHEGTGIGLALVNELVALHGGVVRVESAEGVGTTFTVSIPLGRDHLPAQRIEAVPIAASAAVAPGLYLDEAMGWFGTTEAEAGPGESMGAMPARAEPGSGGDVPRPRVVLADDNADMREYVAGLLRPRFDVEAVANGRAALDAIVRQRPDLVLVDVMMPELDGFGLLEAVRADPVLRNVPIIMLSARAGEEAQIEGLEAGADDYLVKPFSARELVARVVSQIELARVREQVTDALQKSEEHFRTIANTAPAILWMLAVDGTCSFVSSGWHELTGQSEPEALGVGWLEPVHPDDREQSITVFQDAMARRQPFALDCRLRRADGEYRWVNGAARPRFSEEGQFQGYIGSLTDVHERKRAEDALVEADRRKDEFIATLAHELRNPLAPLRIAVELMEVAPDDAVIGARARGIMERQLAVIVRLVEDLLDVNRITRGKVDVRRERIELAQVVQLAVETARPAIEQGHQGLSVELPDDPIFVEGDVTRLAQVLSNLLNNAAKYSEPGRRIWLSAEPLEHEVLVAVRDEGVGIAAEELPIIFDLFRQVDQENEMGRGGLGIGLSISKRIVELHGGRIEAKSDGAGRGSEFAVRLPLSSRLPATEQTGDATTDVIETAGGHRILIVDDNQDNAHSLSLLLKKLGNETRTVFDGRAALDEAAAFRPDVVLLDIGMPGMDGYEAARRIRELPWGATVRLVALTGWGQDRDKLRAAEAGFDVHLVKPVERAALEKLLSDPPSRAQRDDPV